MRILAIVAGYNEQEIVVHTLSHLKQNEIDVWYIDNESTDKTLEAVIASRVAWGISIYPRDNNKYHWRDILKEKERLIKNAIGTYDWVMHHDCDEFRYAPWDMNLRQAIEKVDSMGYTAIDHVLYDFVLTDNVPMWKDPREYMEWSKKPDGPRAFQIKTWKNNNKNINISDHGGHWAIGGNYNVCPTPFIMAHYPLRNEEQARRKVFEERLPCYLPEEHEALAWHEPWTEYKNDPHKSFLVDPLDPKQDLIKVDLEKAREYCLSFK